MKDVNLVAIRERLPHGSLDIIAKRLGIDAKIVSHVLRNGWYSQYRDRVLEQALAIIKGNNDSSAGVLKEADKLGLTTLSLFPVKKKEKQREETTGKPGFADLFPLTKEELEGYITDNRLETNPDDYGSFWKGEEKNRLALLYAVCDELELDIPVWEDIQELERSEMLEVITDLELETDPKNFDNDEELATEICEELGLEEPESEEE